MSAVRDGKKGKCVPQKSESQSPNGGTEIVLEARGLKKSFGGIKALDGLTCRLARGHIAGLIGPNGAGKSTCFDVITGVLGAEAGEVLLFGEDITGTATHRLAAKGLVRSFQLAREMAGLSVLENLMLAPLDQTGERLRPLFSKPRTIRDEERAVHTRALEILDYAKLSHLQNAYARDLSGGQKKLLELARALMIDSEVILLDEPGAGVNPALMSTLVEMIQDLNRRHGKTFFIIEHDMDLVARICDPVIVMTEGKVLTEGPFDEVRRDPLVIEAYLGGARDREAVR
jgi:branched-chain amino acid transport system ATP-binding protein